MLSIALSVACLGFLPFNQWKVSLLYAVVQVIVGIVAILAYKNNVALQIVLVTGYGLLFIFSYKLIKAIKPKHLRQQDVSI